MIQSVDRALAVMEILARTGWSTVTDIAVELGLHKSTVSRLLATMEARAVVERHATARHYRLGPGLVRLANSVNPSIDLAGSARPSCERLADLTGETVTLAVLDGEQVVTIDQVNQSTSVIGVVSWIGRRTALHTTSDGKVFLAYMDSAEIDEVLHRGLDAATPHTITDGTALREQLEQVRNEGYGTTMQELELGLSAVAAPVFGMHGTVVATICVSAPSFRLSAEMIPQVGRLTCAEAAELSLRMGSPTGQVA